MRYIAWFLIQLFYWFCVYFIASWLWVITYPFHKFIKSKWNPIWWVIHDNPTGNPWYWTKLGIPIAKKGEVQQQPKGLKLFWISYNYSVWRNGCWRLFNTILKQKKGEKTDIKIKCHESYDGKNLSVFTVLRMKFKTNGVPTDNVGTEIDLERTYQGKNFVTYKIGKRKYWLYSYCKVKGNKGRELTLGWTGARPIIRRKVKKFINHTSK